MSKKIYLDALYDQYEDFLGQLAEVFPEDPDWARFRTGVAVLRRANPMVLAEKTWGYVSRFEPLIKTRNETFFLTHDFSGIVKNPEPLRQTIAKLKYMWAHLTPSNRSIVWDYVTNITYLAKRCSEPQLG